ncbi:hypothetical protein HYC85_024091 [Camellia sinensis]|uniref:Uncharacterized protein n=1 Tax=Camellia sinensis TaxID=4442 RepID=A0A7J7G8F9_CAMSI|nr:hypothetical protein HYC85_024091 [Camellia sinensis]
MFLINVLYNNQAFHSHLDSRKLLSLQTLLSETPFSPSFFERQTIIRNATANYDSQYCRFTKFC